MTPLKSQMMGLTLAIMTAMGCIFYEKIVYNFSFGFLVAVKVVELLLICVFAYYFMKSDISKDFHKFTLDSKYIIWCLLYILSGATTIFWFIITKNQGVMAGSLYEMKYIVILGLSYIIFGENKFSVNTAIGLVCTLCGIYFISKS